MAILSGINTRLRGSAGDWTFARLNGQTVAKQKVETKENPKRTFAQMIRRVFSGPTSWLCIRPLRATCTPRSKTREFTIN